MRYIVFVSFIVLLAGCDMIRDQLDGNQAPVIDRFEVAPAGGEAHLTTSFAWTITDVKRGALTCTLVFGDEESVEVQNCGQVTNAFHEYGTAGGYVALLTVTDGSNSVTRSVAIRVALASEETTS